MFLKRQNGVNSMLLFSYKNGIHTHTLKHVCAPIEFFLKEYTGSQYRGCLEKGLKPGEP